MLQRRPGTTPIESRGRAVRMPESGEPTFSYAGGAPGTQPQRPTIGPNMNDPANVRPNPAQLAMRNAYSPSVGLSGDRKFLVPSGMGGPGQQVPTIPGMIGGSLGLADGGPFSMLPQPAWSPYAPGPYAQRPQRNYPALRQKRLGKLPYNRRLGVG
jgi:hypothetical protein